MKNPNIVFLLDTETQKLRNERIDAHDGQIFSHINDAREYALNAIKDKLCNKFVIGTFYLDTQMQRMSISNIESFGFRNDKKNAYQLDLFKAY